MPQINKWIWKYKIDVLNELFYKIGWKKIESGQCTNKGKRKALATHNQTKNVCGGLQNSCTVKIKKARICITKCHLKA